MKKALILPSAALLGILLWGCSAPSADALVADASTEDNPESMTESFDSSTELPLDAPTEEVVKNLSGISITTKKEHQSFMAEDEKTCLLDATATYPVVEIENARDTSDKINAAISGGLESFWKFEKENVTYAKEDYNASLENNENTFDPYMASFSYSLKRCDERIISFVISEYDYTGGAHGNPWNFGMTFDAVTGDRLLLPSLSDNRTEFYDMLLNNLTMQSELPAYQEYIFDDFAPEIESSLLKDSNVWYLDNSGITFLSNPYVLGAYAAGTFEFNIAYEDLPGLKSAYQYESLYVRKLFPGTMASHDLNGDGSPDTICYAVPSYIEGSPENLSLNINNTDFSKNLDSMHIDYPWADAYYLTDIDPDDSYVEIAIINDSFDEKSCTHFFRYTTENTLLYVGNVKGSYSKGLDVRYNTNGNLVLADGDGNNES